MKLYPSKQQWENWTLPSKATYISFVSITIFIVLWVISYLTSATREGQEGIRNDQVALKKGQEEIKSLLKSMQVIDRDKGDELLTKYPLGYCLFAIDYKKVIIPYKSQLSTKYTVNWETARVIEFKPNKIILKFPDMYHNNVRFAFDNYFGVNRKVGSSIKAIRLDNMRSIFEILANDDNGVVAVLGFKEVT